MIGRRFFQTRGMRKLMKNRLAVGALAVIVVYLGIAATILIFDVLTLEDTLQRVGSNRPLVFRGPRWSPVAPLRGWVRPGPVLVAAVEIGGTLEDRRG